MSTENEWPLHWNRIFLRQAVKSPGQVKEASGGHRVHSLSNHRCSSFSPIWGHQTSPQIALSPASCQTRNQETNTRGWEDFTRWDRKKCSFPPQNESISVTYFQLQCLRKSTMKGSVNPHQSLAITLRLGREGPAMPGPKRVDRTILCSFSMRHPLKKRQIRFVVSL